MKLSTVLQFLQPRWIPFIAMYVWLKLARFVLTKEKWLQTMGVLTSSGSNFKLMLRSFLWWKCPEFCCLLMQSFFVSHIGQIADDIPITLFQRNNWKQLLLTSVCRSIPNVFAQLIYAPAIYSFLALKFLNFPIRTKCSKPALETTPIPELEHVVLITLFSNVFKTRLQILLKDTRITFRGELTDDVEMLFGSIQWECDSNCLSK